MSKVVTRHTHVVAIAHLLGRSCGGVGDVVLNLPPAHVDERVVGTEIFVLDVTVNQRLGVDRVPCLALFAVRVPASGVLPAGDLEVVVASLLHPADVGGRHLQNLETPKSDIAHKPDRDLALETALSTGTTRAFANRVIETGKLRGVTTRRFMPEAV